MGQDGKPLPKTTPTSYNGGRIYWSEKKRAFRCYLRGYDKVEKSVGSDSGNKKQWAKDWKRCLNMIDADTRAR